jgi:hypothetical protein
VLRAKKRPPLLAAKSREETPKEGTAEDKKLYTDFSFGGLKFEVQRPAG